MPQMTSAFGTAGIPLIVLGIISTVIFFMLWKIQSVHSYDLHMLNGRFYVYQDEDGNWILKIDSTELIAVKSGSQKWWSSLIQENGKILTVFYLRSGVSQVHIKGVILPGETEMRTPSDTFYLMGS